MGERRIINGAIYEKTADGQIVLVGPALNEATSTDVSRIVAPSPVRLAKEAQDRARQRSQDERADRAEARANAAAERAAAAAERAATPQAPAGYRFTADGGMEPVPGGPADKGKDSKLQAQRNAKAGKLNALTRQLLEVERQLEAGFIGDNDRGLLEYLPTETNRTFDAAAAGLSEQAMGAFRTPGVGSQSDAELRAFVRANEPGADEYDGVNRQRIQNIRTRLDEERSAMGLAETAAEQRADNEVPDPTTGAALKPPLPPTAMEQLAADPNGDPTGGITVGAASGKTRTFRDPRLNAQIDAMVNAGASAGMIAAVMRRQGFTPDLPSLTADLATAKQWMKRHPGKRYYGFDASRPEDLSMMQRASGSPLASGIANAGNALTAGAYGAIGGPTVQGSLDAMKASNPRAAMAGGLIGTVGGAMTAEAALAARAPAALARYAPVIADTLYGSATGFNNARDGEGLSGALVGAGAGLAGSLLGSGVLKAAGSVSRGVRDPSAQMLRQQGIPLTIGQATGNSGLLGRAVKGFEDRLTGLPGVGDVVNARRTEGLEAFNRAAFDEALAPINASTGGVIREQGIDAAADAVSQAYDDALRPIQIGADFPFIRDMATVRTQGAAIPQLGDEFGHTLRDGVISQFGPRMSLDGQGVQAALRNLQRDAAAFAPQPRGYEFGEAVRGATTAVEDLVQRQAPGVVGDYNAAKAAFRGKEVLRSAVDKARNGTGSGETGVFTPAQLATAASANARKFGNSAGTTRQPFFDLTRAGQDVLPNTAPDSGTAGRLAMFAAPAALGGAGGGLGYAGGDTQSGVGAGLGAGLLLALGGTRGGQAIATRALMDRPDLAIKLGGILQEQARLGGRVGAATGTNLAVGY